MELLENELSDLDIDALLEPEWYCQSCHDSTDIKPYEVEDVAENGRTRTFSYRCRNCGSDMVYGIHVQLIRDAIKKDVPAEIALQNILDKLLELKERIDERSSRDNAA